jgi:hypothetical protein
MAYLPDGLTFLVNESWICRYAPMMRWSMYWLIRPVPLGLSDQ